jgi:hypothetical protein
MFRRADVLAAAALVLASCEAGMVEIPDLSIHVLEVAPAGPFLLAVGDTLLLEALPRTGDGSIHGSLEIEWSADPEVVAVAEARYFGYRVVLQAVAVGASEVHAKAEGKTGTVSVTVIEPEEGAPW